MLSTLWIAVVRKICMVTSVSICGLIGRILSIYVFEWKIVRTLIFSRVCFILLISLQKDFALDLCLFIGKIHKFKWQSSSRGKCRSVVTVIGYLIAYQNLSFVDAVNLLQKKRPQMKINRCKTRLLLSLLAFLLQLQNYYECGQSIQLANQLFLINQMITLRNQLLAKYHHLRRPVRIQPFVGVLRQYKSCIPASVELWRSQFDAYRLPMPKYVNRQFHCSKCNTSLFRYHK